MSEKVKIPKKIAEAIETIQSYASQGNAGKYIRAVTDGYDIEPEYVSFEKAMEAFGEGRKITYHTAGGFYGPIKETTELAYLRPLMFSDLFQTRWTIEEE